MPATSKISFRGLDIAYANNESFFRNVENGLWEPNTFDILDKYLEPGKTFVDIGAWIAILSIYAAKSGAKVCAIEPDETAFADMVANISTNGLSDSIYMHMAALSNKNGYGYLSNTGAWGDSQSSLLRLNDAIKHQLVYTYTLSAFLFQFAKKEQICLIKIDCEGSEFIFIDEKFVETLVEYDLPPIYISFHPTFSNDLDHDANKIFNILSSHYDFGCTKRQYLDRMSNPQSNHTFLLTRKK